MLGRCATGDHQRRRARHAREQPAVGVEKSADILAGLERAHEQDVAACIGAAGGVCHSGAPSGQTEMRSAGTAEQLLHFAGDETRRRR